MSDYPLIIGGAAVAGDASLPVINPATEEAFATVARASPRQAEQAIAAAKAAFAGWAQTPLAARQDALKALADAMARQRDALARLLTLEQGKPLPEAQGEVDWSVGYLRHYATLAPTRRVVQDDAAARVEVRRGPLGVVAGIAPWNFPLLIACWKIGPAVLAGNSIVLKPSPTTPVTSLKLGEICNGIFPAGVVNVIADDNDLGPLLTSHPDIAKVSFTGSAATGRKIMRAGADTLKRLTLELGGNDPAIVLEDVDVATTAPKIFGAAFLNCGQVCMAIKRVYVHEAVHDDLAAALAQLAEEAVVGDGLEQGTRLGPLQNQAQFAKVRDLAASARRDGRVLTGGGGLDRPGYFMRPMIVADVADGQRIVDEEQFGPILPLVKVRDGDDSVARANGSPYGLGASVWSADPARASALAERLDAGTVWVNQHIAIGPHIPMAGAKQSGIGVEQAQEGLDEFTQMRVFHVAKP
ncbi:MAG: aldehyde dehydrogenase family protein [Alphaproteobacteria bacterium]|nr:MAG: aldehyde dehydrogenase family protein [Alphaproteobacteria bacterium]